MKISFYKNNQNLLSNNINCCKKYALLKDSRLLAGNCVELTGGVGPEVSCGGYGLNLAPDGIFVTNKYTEIDDTNKWKSIFTG